MTRTLALTSISFKPSVLRFLCYTPKCTLHLIFLCISLANPAWLRNRKETEGGLHVSPEEKADASKENMFVSFVQRNRKRHR